MNHEPRLSEGPVFENNHERDGILHARQFILLHDDELGGPDRAIRAFRTALALDPNYATARENLLKAWALKKERLDIHSK